MEVEILVIFSIVHLPFLLYLLRHSNSNGQLYAFTNSPFSICWLLFSHYLWNIPTINSTYIYFYNSPLLLIFVLFIYLFIYFKFIYFYFWLCWVFISVRGLSLVAASGGHSSSWCTGLSLSRPLLLWSTGSRHAGSVVVAHGPSWSVACGIFPDQGSNQCPLHWQADSQPLRHQGSPCYIYFYVVKFYSIYFLFCHSNCI